MGYSWNISGQPLLPSQCLGTHGYPTLTPVQPQGFHGIARQDSLMKCYTKERGQTMYVLCLVGGFNPLKNMKVSWDYYSQYMAKKSSKLPIRCVLLLTLRRIERYYWRSSHVKVTQQQLNQYSSIFINMGVSENSVPLNPMVNDHYPY